MSFSKLPTPDVKLDALIAQALEKFDIYPAGADRRWLLVDVFEQRLVLVQGNTPQGAWPVSTAQVGLDNRQDSGGTPPGAHQIVSKIGTGSPLGTVKAGQSGQERESRSRKAKVAEKGAAGRVHWELRAVWVVMSTRSDWIW